MRDDDSRNKTRKTGIYIYIVLSRDMGQEGHENMRDGDSRNKTWETCSICVCVCNRLVNYTHKMHYRQRFNFF